MNIIKKLLSDKDEKNLINNILLAFVVKGLSMVVSLFSMPLYIKYFDDNTALGFWYTILSMLTWISVCDLGLGNGLRNRLTEALALNDEQGGKRIVSSVYIIIAIIIVPIVIALNALVYFFDLNTFFNVPTSVVSEDALKLSICILLCGVGLSFVLKLISNVIYAIQKSSLNNVLTLISSVLPLVYIAIFKGKDTQSNLIVLSLIHAIAVNIPLFAASVILFSGKTLRKYRPSLKAFDVNTAKGTLNFGFQFFLAQIFFMLLMSTNEIYITRFFSADSVVDYSIYYRLFMLIGSMLMVGLTPIWSKVTKDLAQKNYSKIQKTNKVLYAISFFTIILEFVIIPFVPWLVKIWLRENAIAINFGVAAIFAAFGGLYILNVVLTTVANGIGNLKSQIIFYGIGAILKVPIVLLFKLQYDHWIIVVAYNCIVLMSFGIYQIYWVEKEIKKLIKLEKQ